MSKQANGALLALPACALAFVSPACAESLPVSSQDRLISIHRTLFDIYQRQQNFEDALREGGILESLTKDPEISKTLGEISFLKNRYGEALTYFKRALEVGGPREDLDAAILVTLLQLNRYDEIQVVRQRIESARAAKEAKLYPQLPLPAACGSDIPWRTPTSKEASRTSMLNGQGRQMQPVGMLPASAHRISITLTQCDFKLVHERRADILLIANYPTHWKNISGSLTQIGLGRYPVGHFHTINGEENWTGAVTISPDGITINGMMFEKFPVGSTNLSFAASRDDSAMINKEKVRIGPLDPNDKSEADIVQLLVPLDYSGDLELRTNGGTKGDYWNGGISLFTGRPATVRFEKVTADKQEKIETSGYANLLINNLEAKRIGLSTTETSILKIDFVKALEISLKATDRGKIQIQSGTANRVHTDGVTKNILFYSSSTQVGN